MIYENLQHQMPDRWMDLFTQPCDVYIAVTNDRMKKPTVNSDDKRN